MHSSLEIMAVGREIMPDIVVIDNMLGENNDNRGGGAIYGVRAEETG